jgi:hypothetical protein
MMVRILTPVYKVHDLFVCHATAFGCAQGGFLLQAPIVHVLSVFRISTGLQAVGKTDGAGDEVYKGLTYG